VNIAEFEERYCPEPNSGCFLWLGPWSAKGGYGRVMVAHQNLRAHRLAWELYRGPIPPGEIVMHRCDTPCCVNPDHLVIGTVAENNQHKALRDRCKRKTKIRGVYPRRGRFAAYGCGLGGTLCLGVFDTEAQAAEIVERFRDARYALGPLANNREAVLRLRLSFRGLGGRHRPWTKLPDEVKP